MQKRMFGAIFVPRRMHRWPDGLSLPYLVGQGHVGWLAHEYMHVEQASRFRRKLLTRLRFELVQSAKSGAVQSES